MISNFKRNMRVLKVLVRLRFQNLMMFRLGFFGPFLVDGSLFFVQLLVFQAVYSNVDRIGTWGKGEMIIFIGTFSFINAIGMTVYFFGVNSIPQKIKGGEMDLYLTKPVSPLFRLSFGNINPGSLPLVVMSIMIICHGVSITEAEFGIIEVLSYIFWLAVMNVLYYEMMVIIRSISFYIISTARIEQLEEVCLELCMQLPGTAFYGIYKAVLCFILPYGIMATIPVQSLICEMNLKTGLQGICVVCVFTFLTYFLWTEGKKHYNSTGS